MCLFSQSDSNKFITGQTRTSNLEILPYVDIKISSKKNIAFSDADGKFKIEANSTDTLVFSAVGYENLVMPVSKLTHEYNYISMYEKIYSIEAVDILESRWQDFKYDMMHTELDASEQKVLVIKGLPDPFTRLVPVPPTISNPASLIYEFLKKENIRKRKIKRWNHIYEKTYIKVIK